MSNTTNTTVDRIEGAIRTLNTHGVELLQYVVEEDIMHLDDEARAEALDALEVLRRHAPDTEFVCDALADYNRRTDSIEIEEVQS